jgi:hypothetical protein
MIAVGADMISRQLLKDFQSLQLQRLPHLAGGAD